MKCSLTTGSIGKSLISFSLPMIFGNLIQQLYNVADTLIVGKTIGSTALSAVGSSYSLMVLLTSIILGLCMGSGVVFAQLYGANQKDDMKISIFNSFLFILIVSIATTALSYLLLEHFIVWIHAPKETIAFMRDYLSIIFAGIFFVSIYNFAAAVLRSIGNTVIPLIFLAVSAVTNIVLDIVFIVVFHLSVKGAAIATVLAQALSAVCITLYLFTRARYLCPGKEHMHYSKHLLRRVLSNSTLTALQQSIMNFGILMVQGLVNSFGFAVSAGFTVAVKIDAFAYMPAQDFGNAFSTYVAQNYGAKNMARIHKGSAVAAKISAGFCLAISALVWIFAKQLMLLFVNGEDTEIIAVGIQYLHIVGACYIGIGLLFLLYGLYRGLGRSWISILLTVISLGSRVLLAYVLSSVKSLGTLGIWWAVPIGWALADLYGIGYYLRNRQRLLAPL